MVEMTPICNNQQKLSFRGAITHCGVPFDVFKSALQKCFRRCENGSLEWFIQEIMCMKIFSEPSDKKAKQNITNILNRLRVIAIEDVSPRCVTDVAKIGDFLSKWDCSNRTDFHSLAIACWILCNAKKLRICSHLRILSHPYFVLCYATDELWNQISLEHIKTSIHGNTSRKVTAFLLGLYYRKMLGLDKHFDIVNCKSKITTKARKRKIFSPFWNYLKSLCQENSLYLLKNLSFKQEFFQSRDYFREEFLCIISAVEAVRAFLLGIDLKPVETPQLFGIEDDWPKKHECPVFGDHVYDCHVSKGNRSVAFFLDKGAFVENEDSEWALTDVENMYREIKSSTSSQSHFSSRNNTNGENNTLKRRRRMPQTTNDNKKRKKRHQSLSLKFVKETICKNNFLDLEKSTIIKVCTPKSLKGVVLVMKKKTTDDDNQEIGDDDDDGAGFFIVKHMKKSLNFGIDQLACHEIKHQNLLELPFLHVPNNMPANLFWSNVFYSREDKKFRKQNGEECIYMVMGCVGDGCNDVRVTRNYSSAFHLMENNIDVFHSIISIIIFRSILGVTDTNFSNVLIDDTRMYSVDENFIGEFSCKEVLNCIPVQRMITYTKKTNPHRSLAEAFPLWFNADLKKSKQRVMERVLKCLRNYKISNDKIEVVEKNFIDIVPCLQNLYL